MALLAALSGRPGVGKTSIARALARRSRTIHLRVDTVEAALSRSALRIRPAKDAGCLALVSVAIDTLRFGSDVIADTVNPVPAVRDLWAVAAASAHAALLNIEATRADRAPHRTPGARPHARSGGA